jgi:hypothetical protein
MALASTCSSLAILTFAVDVTTSGLNLNTVGVILMVAGVIGLLLSLLFWSGFSPTAVASAPPCPTNAWLKSAVLSVVSLIITTVDRASSLGRAGGHLRRAVGAGRLADADSEPPHRLHIRTVCAP